MDASHPLRPTTSLPSISSSRKLFKFFRNAKKNIYDKRGLRILTKNHHKNLKSLEDREYDFRGIYDPSNNGLQRETLKYFIKIMRQNKSLSSLKLSIHGTRPFHTCFILSALKNLRALRTCNVQYQSFRSMTPKVCLDLTRCLKNLKQLANFDSNLYCILEMNENFIINSLLLELTGDSFSPSSIFQDMSYCGFLYSFRNLTKLNHLESLPMTFSNADVLNDSSLPFFSSCLARLPALKSLSLKLVQCQGITKKGFLHLSNSLSKLSLLTSLNLQILGSNVLRPSSFISLFENLGNLMNFQELTLNLSQCEHLSVDCLAAGLSLLNPSLFRRLSLEIDAKFCCNADLSKLFFTIQRFLLLTHLSILFPLETHITSQDFISFLTTLSYLPCLVHLNFRINPTTTDTESCFKLLSLLLGNLNQLKSLTIKASVRNEADNLGIQQFCSQLSHLSTLEHLDLYFDVLCPGLDSAWIGSVSEVLLDLIELQSLHLRFNMKEQNEEIFEGLILRIGFLKKLKRLKLDFWNCFEMSTEMLAAFTVSLKSLVCLNEVEIGLRKPNLEATEKYEHLIRVLAGLETVTDICLKLPVFHDYRYFRQVLRKTENGPKNFCFH